MITTASAPTMSTRRHFSIYTAVPFPPDFVQRSSPSQPTKPLLRFSFPYLILIYRRYWLAGISRDASMDLLFATFFISSHFNDTHGTFFDTTRYTSHYFIILPYFILLYLLADLEREGEKVRTELC